MSVADKTKIALIANAEGVAATTGKLYAALPFDNSADPTVTRALDTATRVNSVGNIENVVANKGRISYELGTNKCPNILVEKNSTNIFQFTEDFSNGYWAVNLGTLTANTTIAPNGTLTADTYVKTSAVNTVSEVRSSLSPYLVTGIHTMSIFVKTINATSVLLRLDSSGNTCNTTFTFATKTFVNSGPNVISSTFEEFKDGWIKLSITGNVLLTSWTISLVNLFSNATGESLYIWGAQLETGTLSTSYVPRLDATAVTRNADVITKTGISSIIPQTKGGLFFDGYLQAGSLSDGATRIPISIFNSNSPTQNSLYIFRFNNVIGFEIFVAGVSQGINSTNLFLPLKNKRIKILITYELNNVKFYINDLLVFTDTSSLIPTLNSFSKCSPVSGSQWDGLIKAVAVTDELDATEIDQLFQFSSYAEMASEMLYTTN